MQKNAVFLSFWQNIIHLIMTSVQYWTLLNTQLKYWYNWHSHFLVYDFMNSFAWNVYGIVIVWSTIIAHCFMNETRFLFFFFHFLSQEPFWVLPLNHYLWGGFKLLLCNLWKMFNTKWSLHFFIRVCVVYLYIYVFQWLIDTVTIV